MSVEEREARDSAPGVCPDCGGPARAYLGSVHKFRCTDCVKAVIGLDRPAAYRKLPEWVVAIGNREGVLK